MSNTVFNTVILHDAARRQWLAFRDPALVVEARQVEAVLPALRQVEALVNEQGLTAAGFLSYEAAPAFDPSLRVRPSRDEFPLLWFGLYPRPEVVPSPAPAPLPLNGEWTPSVSQAEYGAVIDCIKERIARGDTYQVNYTLRLRRPFDGDAWALFRALNAAQRAAYPVYVDLGRYAVCSVSPELFFARQGRQVTARPMKGTAPRGRWSAEDRAQADWLQHSEKNRAENVMIVDMLRNDLGRVADVGSVAVPRLFEVERYPTVWQMTSTVTANSGVSQAGLLQALFPCASITGAPKTRTTHILAELESDPRRIYTGCLGFFGPDGRAQFNVAIRTVLVDRETSQAEYGVGGGIVWDSDAGDEYAEWRNKARVLTEPRPDFALFETLLWSRATGGYWLLEYHLRRLEQSADYFGFAFDMALVREKLAALARMLTEAHIRAEATGLAGPRILAEGEYRVRLQLEAAGAVNCTSEPFDGQGAKGRAAADTDEGATAVRLGPAPGPVDSSQRWLYHKTTQRQVYAAARAACPDCDDVLLWNERGEVTETCVGNVVARIGGRLVTPPVSCGLLPGTMRAWLVEQGEVIEQVIRVDQLDTCEFYRINALRGWQRAVLLR